MTLPRLMHFAAWFLAAWLSILSGSAQTKTPGLLSGVNYCWRVERNMVVPVQGDYLIFRDFSGDIIWWCFTRNAGKVIEIRPGQMALILDASCRNGGPKSIKTIYFREYIEYATDHDQELREREKLPEHLRRGLD